ncbi:protein FAR1-RELATED SEQUENCE 5-like [Arachis ipaensis]|uniref:protein FAR1-RELATED SEQUENCE 5-like n=1 Tax=Arachis ipaensis TaxID=130454 RepID=UPI0007AEF505|nr:protein FAR1-RELATED SEQUENCE 5-like [Arachis ipaensis]
MALLDERKRELTIHAKCVIQDNDEAGIRPNKTYLTLANEVGGSSNLGYSEKDVRNYITSNLRFDVDEANKFKSALWVDARCRASYEYYGDMVSFDTMYSRNKHGLPFAYFIGVNHHGKSTLLGCALLGNEEIHSFEWVFKYSPPMVHMAHNEEDTAKSSEDMLGSVLTILNFRSRCHRVICNLFGYYYGISLFESQLFMMVIIALFSSGFVDLYDDRRIWVPIYFQDRVSSCYVLPRWSKNVQCKYTFIKSSHDEKQSDESHNLFRGLCSHFFNVAQNFMTCEEEAAMLHSGLDELRAKLFDYCANLGPRSVPTT